MAVKINPWELIGGMALTSVICLSAVFGDSNADKGRKAAVREAVELPGDIDWAAVATRLQANQAQGQRTAEIPAACKAKTFDEMSAPGFGGC